MMGVDSQLYLFTLSNHLSLVAKEVDDEVTEIDGEPVNVAVEVVV